MPSQVETLTKQIESDAKLAVSPEGDQAATHKLFEDLDALRKDAQLAKAVNERLHKDEQADPSLPRVGAIVQKDGTVDALIFGPSVTEAKKNPDATAIISEPLDAKGYEMTHAPGNPLAHQFMHKFYPNLIKPPPIRNDVA